MLSNRITNCDIFWMNRLFAKTWSFSQPETSHRFDTNLLYGFSQNVFSQNLDAVTSLGVQSGLCNPCTHFNSPAQAVFYSAMLMTSSPSRLCSQTAVSLQRHSQLSCMNALPSPNLAPQKYASYTAQDPID